MPEINSSNKQAGTANWDRRRTITWMGLIAEILFVFLPLLVLAIVFVVRGTTLLALFSSPEWSFATAILFGQAIVKLVAGVTHKGASVWQPVAFIVTAMIVLGLVPSLVILALILTATNLSIPLVAIQMVLFVLAIIVFFAFGGYGLLLLES